jgi:hypothetical protein
MANFSDYFENQIIDDLLKAGTPYVALFRSPVSLAATDEWLEANDGGEGEYEVAGTGYARQAITLKAGGAGALDPGETNNTGAIEFPMAGADWGEITHFAIVDHETNTNWGTNVNIRMWGRLTAAKTVNNTDTFSFPDESIEITID